MGLVSEINRDFPYQVALSFDDAAMEVLDWLEERGAAWDMYVDLPANTVRYCFRDFDDAAAFREQFSNAPEGRAVAGRYWSGLAAPSGVAGSRLRGRRLQRDP